MSDKDLAKEIAKLSFEAALSELETIVSTLEKGQVPLEESIKLYERGELLKKHCESLLKSAEQRIEKITLGSNSELRGTEPLE
jgi:exodeoxyribonuclease VII small subunit